TANILINSTKEPREKSAIRVYDGRWTNQDEFYQALEQLKQIHMKRQLYYTIQKAVNRFDEADAEELIASFQYEISGLYYSDGGQNIIDARERAPIALAEFWERLDNPELAKGIPYSYTNMNGIVSGFPSLDKSFYGAHGGDLIMIAAKTGEGKTAFALNL